MFAHHVRRAGIKRRLAQGAMSVATIAVISGAGLAATTVHASTQAAPAGKRSAATAPVAYVANGGSGTVTPITTVHTAGKPIKVGKDPVGLAVTPNGKTLYVANLESNTVTPIRTATNTAGRPIKVGLSPRMIAITPDGKTAYVVDSARTGMVTPITIATNTAGKPIMAGGMYPQMIAITPDGKTAYLAGGSSVIPISTATNRPGKSIKVPPGGPNWIAITPNGKTAYDVNYGTGDFGTRCTVTPISTATNIPGKPITIGGRGCVLDSMVITPDGKTGYVSKNCCTTVTPINTASNIAGKPINVGAYPSPIAITPDGKTLYVVSEGPNTHGQHSPLWVTAISTATNIAGKPVKLPATVVPNVVAAIPIPRGIVISPDGKTLYVLTAIAGLADADRTGVRPHGVIGSGAVTPIKTATNTVQKAIRVGSYPQGIVIIP